MSPVLALALIVGGSFVALNLVAARRKALADAEFDRLSAERHAATELEQGRTYGVVTMIDPRGAGWSAASLEQASDLVRATFEALGWRVLSRPQLRHPEDAGRFGDAPTEWTLTGTWTRPDRVMSEIRPAWLVNALAYLLPVTGR